MKLFRDACLSTIFFAATVFNHAEASLKVTDNIWFDGYVRLSYFWGNAGQPARKLIDWSDFQLTLFDETYIEGGPKFRYKNFQGSAVFAINNKYGYAPPTNLPEAQLFSKDVYLEAYDIGTLGSSAWFGIRKYQIIDEHDIVGGGYRYRASENIHINVAYGTRPDFGYWGTDQQLGFESPRRHDFILHVEQNTSANSNIKYLAEYQYINSVVAAPLVDPSRQYQLDSVNGYMAASEFSAWGSGWSNSTAMTFSLGDVGGTGLSKFNTKCGTSSILDATGQNQMKVDCYKQYSRRLTLTNFGIGMFDKFSYTYLIAFSYDGRRNVPDQGMNFLQTRPFYHLTSWVHLGADLSRSTMLHGHTEPNTWIVAPVARFSLRQDMFAQPYLEAFCAVAFYDEPYMIYGQVRSVASTVGLQLSLVL